MSARKKLLMSQAFRDFDVEPKLDFVGILGFFEAKSVKNLEHFDNVDEEKHKSRI
jgi:hypothetical protein